MIVQIYGFTVPEDVAAVRGAGIDHIGIALDEGFGNWDAVDERTAASIIAEIPPSIRKVGLSLAVDLGRIRRTLETLEPDILHLARVAGAVDPEVLAGLRDEISPVQLMTTVPVVDAACVGAAVAYAACSDWLLLDSRDPANGQVGATGLIHDWTLSARIAATVGVPAVLAGGLGPENVAEAIATVRPAGVDSETRTSRPGDRRRKDPELVRRFVEIARRA